MAGTYDIYCDQGATFRRVITWRDEAGTAIDLTGSSARMMVRDSYASSSPTLSLTSPSGGIVLGGSAGTITVTISAAQTAAIPMPTAAGVKDAFNGVYDLEIVGSTFEVTRLLEGRFICSPEATR